MKRCLISSGKYPWSHHGTFPSSPAPRTTRRSCRGGCRRRWIGRCPGCLESLGSGSLELSAEQSGNVEWARKYVYVRRYLEPVIVKRSSEASSIPFHFCGENGGEGGDLLESVRSAEEERGGRSLPWTLNRSLTIDSTPKTVIELQNRLTYMTLQNILQ